MTRCTYARLLRSLPRILLWRKEPELSAAVWTILPHFHPVIDSRVVHLAQGYTGTSEADQQ